jgi:hypothetical protein
VRYANSIWQVRSVLASLASMVGWVIWLHASCFLASANGIALAMWMPCSLCV